MTMLVRGRNVLYIDCINATNIFEGRPESAGLLRNVRPIFSILDDTKLVINEHISKKFSYVHKST